MESAPIRLEGVNHYFGSGNLRKQILHDDLASRSARGEIVIVTGPSGSGKTTMLTLIGALRSAQEGSVRVLGEELRGASARTLAEGPPRRRLHLPGPQPARRAVGDAERDALAAARPASASATRESAPRNARRRRPRRAPRAPPLAALRRPAPARRDRPGARRRAADRARRRADRLARQTVRPRGRRPDAGPRPQAGRDGPARHPRQPHPRHRRPDRPPRGRPPDDVHRARHGEHPAHDGHARAAATARASSSGRSPKRPPRRFPACSSRRRRAPRSSCASPSSARTTSFQSMFEEVLAAFTLPLRRAPRGRARLDLPGRRGAAASSG